MRAQSINDTPPTEQHVCVDTQVKYSGFGFSGYAIEWHVKELAPDDNPIGTGTLSTTSSIESKDGNNDYIYNDNGTIRVLMGSTGRITGLDLSEPTALSLTSSITNATCTGNSDGAIDLTVIGDLEFSGGSYVDIGISLLNSKTAFTIEGWVEFDQDYFSDNAHVGFFGQDNVVEFGIKNEKLVGWVRYGNTGYKDLGIPLDQLPVSGMHHVAFVGNIENTSAPYNYSIMMYVDGSLKTSKTWTSSQYPFGHSSSTSTIGAGVWNNSNLKDPYAGVIRDVRFWETALDASQVDNYMNNPIGDLSTNPEKDFLIAAYPLSETTGDIASDIGPNGYHAEKIGSSWGNTYSYSWSNSATTEDLKDIGAGTYTVTVADNEGSTASESITIGVAPDVEKPVLADLSSTMFQFVCPADGSEENNPQTAVVTGLTLPAAKYSDNCSSGSGLVVQYKIQLPDASYANDYGTAATDAVSASDPSGYKFPEGVSTLYFKVLDESGNESEVKSYTISVDYKPKPSGITF